MKTSTKMFAMNLAIKSIIGIIEDSETFEDMLDGIDYALHTTYQEMEYWCNVNTQQFMIEEIEAHTYQRFMSDAAYYFVYKDKDPSLAQTYISDFGVIVRKIYDM